MSAGTIENGQVADSKTVVVPPPVNQPPARQVAPPREVRVVHDDGPLAYLLDTARFEHMQRIASAMGLATVLPDHLRLDSKTKQPLSDDRVKANCLLIVNQALRWNVDPFALAAESYVVGGKLAYQGKLVAAIVNTRSGIEGRLAARYTDGKGNDLRVIISGKFPDEPYVREIEVSVGEARTQNDMWTKDPRQKLWYTGAIKWARRHCPEVLLGVLTDDDMDRIKESRNASEPAHLIDATVIPGGQSKSQAIAAEMAARRMADRQDEPPNNGEESQVPPETASEQSQEPPLEHEVAKQISRDIETASDMDRFENISGGVSLIKDDVLRVKLYDEIKARQLHLGLVKKKGGKSLPGTE